MLVVLAQLLFKKFFQGIFNHPMFSLSVTNTGLMFNSSSRFSLPLNVFISQVALSDLSITNLICAAVMLFDFAMRCKKIINAILTSDRLVLSAIIFYPLPDDKNHHRQ